MHAKDENRIQNDVADCSDQHGKHTGFRKSLSRDEHVHAQCQLHKNGSQRVDIHVADCIFNRVFTGAKCQKKLPVKQEQYRCEDGRDHDLQHETVTKNFLCLVIILFSHVDGSPRRSAASHQSRKRRYDHNQRHADTHTGQSQGSGLRNMADINPVYNVVKHIDELRGNGRNCQGAQQLPDGFLP